MRLREEDGFTLIETLIALVIMIAVATMLYRGFSGGLRAANTADSAEEALLVAQSRLAGLGIETPLGAGEQQGQDGDVLWRIAMRPHAAATDEAATGPKAFWATVTVTWREKLGARRSLALTTLKLEQAQ
jgi:general secretion pathway protein I